VGPGKVVHHLETAGERGDAGGDEAVPQEVQLLHRELSLLQVDGKAVGYQALEHGPQVLHVLVKVPTCHPLVI
jgi:hypothetical protein